MRFIIIFTKCYLDTTRCVCVTFISFFLKICWHVRWMFKVVIWTNQINRKIIFTHHHKYACLVSLSYAYFHLDFQGVERFPYMFFVDIETLMKRVTNSINGLYYVVSASKAKQIQFIHKHTIYQYPTKIKTFDVL